MDHDSATRGEPRRADDDGETLVLGRAERVSAAGAGEGGGVPPPGAAERAADARGRSGGAGASPPGPGGGGDEPPLVLDADRRVPPARPHYAKEGPSLFWLALRGGLLTLLTLGIYRFWLTARLRRHYWNALRLDGDPFEYTGTGLEKFIGFLMAVILLAVYLGVVNLVLTFVGLSYFQGSPVALQLSVLAVVPLLFFARYRARRYILARTRWRGIRFGMDPGALGYMLRASVLWALTILSLGVLYPLLQFRLARYMAERSWFGTLRFRQEGSWVGLLAYWIWVYVVAGVMAVVGWAMAADAGNASTIVVGGAVMSVGYLALAVIYMRYEVAAFRYLWSNRSLGEARFRSEVTPAQIISLYVVGSLLVALCTALVLAALFALAGGVAMAALGLDGIRAALGALLDPGASGGVRESTGAALALGAVLGYLVAAVFGFAFSQVFIIRPVLRRKAETMLVEGLERLALSRQRAHDRAAEAGGFADALGVDAGAGF